MKWPVSSVLFSLLLLVGAVGCSPSSPTPVVPPIVDPPIVDPPIVNPPPGTVIPLPTLKVDPSVKPSFPSLPDSDGGPRPVSSVTDAKGNQRDFVQNELIVTTKDAAKLEALLSRYKGKLLRTLKPEDPELATLEPSYLIRVDAGGADPSKLSADLRALDPLSRGELRVSSEGGEKLISAAAHEGNGVGLNWISTPSGFTDRSTVDTPVGVGAPSYASNAFNWPFLNAGSVQDIGVTEAWRSLELGGKLNNKVVVADLDIGFHPDAEFPPNRDAFSSVIGEAALENCLSLCSSAAWHGSNVVDTLAGRVDNQYGAAGVAGPVVDKVILGLTDLTEWNNIEAMIRARARGAKIINMSFGGRTPAGLGWTQDPFRLAAFAVRTSGTLLFASAGNDGKDVDETDCFIKCWEEGFWTPCEFGSVICIGGLAENSKDKATGSNYGKNDVRLFAPYTMWVGPDPDHSGTGTHRVQGTSFSSPYAAGVAALIWAANPSLSAGQVETVLRDSAHYSQDSRVNHYVNAQAAVKQALGNVGPALEFTSPVQGATVQVGVNTGLNVRAIDLEDGNACCLVTVRSSVEGLLGSAPSGGSTAQVGYTFTTLGPRTITATATDSSGKTGTTTISITVVNTPPTVNITAPTDGVTVFRGTALTLRGTSYDPNEPDQILPCSSLRWSTDLAADGTATGCTASLTFSSNGARILTLTGTDSQGASAKASVKVSVVNPPPDLPPTVRITAPANNASVGPSQDLTLSATASDPEGKAVTVTWTVSSSGSKNGPWVSPKTIGTGTTRTWKPDSSYPRSGCETYYWARLQATGTDPAGGSGQDFVVVNVTVIC